MTKEECSVKIKELNNQIDNYRNQIDIHRKIVSAKIKGKIRISQRSIKELKQLIKDCQASKQPYYNGGIW